MARSRLLAPLLAWSVVAVLLFPANPAGAQAGTADYDTDNNGLIEVNNLARLNAIRWDLDGNGTVAASDQANYAAAFGNAVAGMGCPVSGCTGYELIANLDFDTNNDGSVDDGDAFANWVPIGTSLDGSHFEATFDGGGHVISNLRINRGAAARVGLFGYVGSGGTVRNVGLENVDVVGQQWAGALVGYLDGGTVQTSYSTGSVRASTNGGGLVGQAESSAQIRTSYSTASVNANSAGGLVGNLRGSTIRASYATGSVRHNNNGGLVGISSNGTVIASYATGSVARGGDSGGLIGSGGATVTNSYWDADTSGQSGSGGRTTSQLQSPTGYSGIYINWNIDADGAAGADDPWDFGTASQYPALKVDFNGDGNPTAAEFGDQRPSASATTTTTAPTTTTTTTTAPTTTTTTTTAPTTTTTTTTTIPPGRVDYDDDGDGLIEIDGPAQLNALRWDSDGNGAVDAAASAYRSAYEAAFPDGAPGMGCPATADDADDDDCLGYELTADLDLDTNGSGGADSGDDYWNGGSGWEPFRYHGIFEGNRHTVSNLHVNRPDGDQVGLFSTVGTRRGGVDYGEVRNLGLENVDVTGREYVGGLAGRAYGSVRRVYTTGEVMGEKMVGGLVGEARNLISETYSKADVTGVGWESSNVGGLVGYLRLGAVKASYAIGDVSGMTWVGGLVGHNSSSDDGGVIAGYATGNLGFAGLEDSNAVPGRWVDGFSSRYYLPYTPTWVGGLVGDSSGPVVASYSTGGHPISLARYQPGERKDRSRRDLAYMMEVHWKVGGLVGKSYGRQERDSYWDTVTSRHRPGHKDWVYGKGKTTSELQSVTGYEGIYANWNVDLDGDGAGDDPWDFGSGAHYPTLKVDFNGDGTATAYEFGGQGRTANDHVPLVGNTGVSENTPSGAPIFGVTLPLAPAAASSYRMFQDAQWPDTAHFRLDPATGQLFTRRPLDYESKDTYRLRITASGTGGARPSNGIIIRVTDVAEPPGPPAIVSVVALSHRLRVSWTPPDMTGKPPLLHYEISIVGLETRKRFAPAGVTTYTLTRLTPTVNYPVYVRAMNAEGYGPDSAAAFGTPLWFPPSASATGAPPASSASATGAQPASATGAPPVRRSAPARPGQPGSVTVTRQTDGSAWVTWDAPAEGGPAAFYRVRRRVDAADSSYDMIVRRVEDDDGDGVIGHHDKASGLESGQRYLYSVRAFGGDGKPLGRWTAGANVDEAPAPAVNEAPAFAAATAAVEVAENTAAGAAISGSPTATDPDAGDTLTYTLGGTDSSHFSVDSKTGKLHTSGALDYETKGSYAVVVTATDSGGLSAGIAVTITVTNVNEAPGQPDAPEIINVKQTSFRVTWTAPAEGSSAITGYGIQHKLTSEADSAYADVKPRPRATGTGYNVVNRRGQSITAGTSYDMRVRARNAEGWGPWSEAATVTTAAPPNQAPAFASSTLEVNEAPTPPPQDDQQPNDKAPTPPPQDDQQPNDKAPAPPPQDDQQPNDKAPTPPPQDDQQSNNEAPTPPPQDDQQSDDKQDKQPASAGATELRLEAHHLGYMVAVRWNAIDGAAYYFLQREGKQGGRVIGLIYYDTRVEEGVSYQYTATAYSSEGEVLAEATAAAR